MLASRLGIIGLGRSSVVEVVRQGRRARPPAPGGQSSVGGGGRSSVGGVKCKQLLVDGGWELAVSHRLEEAVGRRLDWRSRALERE
jgi:hypothetical protein